MIKPITCICFVCFLVGMASGQVVQPVTWDFSAHHVEGETYRLIFKATIDEGWAIYSQDVGDNGPIPTSFTFDAGEFDLIGTVQESDNGKTQHDPIFEMKLTKFTKWAEFSQTVRVPDRGAPVTGYLTFMCCDEERCLPPRDVEFTFYLNR